MVSVVFLKRILVFCLALLLGIGAVAVLDGMRDEKPTHALVNERISSGMSFGDFGSGENRSFDDESRINGFVRSGSNELRLISKPRPLYTDRAREDKIQGTVILRITFRASGAIGVIRVVNGLSDDLVKQSIAAAKQIRFQPATLDGVPISVTRQVEYVFSLY